MPENSTGGSPKTNTNEIAVRHQGRGSQVWIYFGKMLRMFIYQSDWKFLPMSALIAGLVGMVIRRRMFINMEGTIMGSFALVCVGIWNGCFNSIQVVCRERDVIKREHRSGMHISSYIVSHMLYQALICLMETVITLYVTKMTGVRYPEEGMFTPWMIVDFGISMMLITYASDMLSLWVSSLARSSTTAMTIMPFVLIFQLVFSGGMLAIPGWAKPMTNFTISNPGMNVIAAQADTNHQPFVTISEMLGNMRDSSIEVNLTLGRALDMLEKLEYKELNDVIALLRADPEVQAHMEDSETLRTTVGKLLDIAGEEAVDSYLEKTAASASYVPEYEKTKENIMQYWERLALFVGAFALLAMITLEFIDRDKR